MADALHDADRRAAGRLAVAQARAVLEARRAARRRALLSSEMLWLYGSLPLYFAPLVYMQWGDQLPEVLRPVLLGITVVFGIVGAFGVLAVVAGAVMLPFFLIAMVWELASDPLKGRAWFGRLVEADLGELLADLERDGHVSAERCAGKEAAVARLRELVPTLVHDAEGLRPGELVAVTCERCGASPMRVDGPGQHRCEYCEHRVYREPPLRSDALAKARAALDAVARGRGKPLPTRAEVRRALIQAQTPFYRPMRRLTVALVLGVIVTGLAEGLGYEAASTLQVFLAIPAAFLLPAVVYLSYQNHKAFQPGMAAFDQAVRAEVLRVLAVRGRMPMDELAAHLELERAHLDQVVHGLAQRDGAPLYRVPATDELVSLHAGTTTRDNVCPECGGQLGSAARARLRCSHCGTELLGRV